MRSLTDDMEHYHKAFGVYHRLADRNNVMGRWVDSQLPQIFKDLNVALADQDVLKVLSVGPGDGEIENGILRVLHDEKMQYKNFHVTVVEPAVDMVDKYKARVSADASQQQGMTYDWKTQTLDGYTEGNKATKFHFISSLHSIYYAEDLQASLKNLFCRLEPGGMMLVVVISDKSGFGQFGKSFPLLWGNRHHHPTSAEVQAACDKESIPVAQEFTIKVRSNITPCFAEPGAMVDDGRLLLDFFSHVADFVRDASPSHLQEVREFLGSDRCSERVEDDQVYFNGDWKALIIKR
ncbi:histamine N-methyltransferase-like [Patiria miniata]|uniref:Histamine N-methyltransferase n=1 Tax=Patiria miniata TaxID=46514 RepID=A0A913ZC53_PATMI|nr:histamine N-methyltransferase-like [Patiria miniata]XP_038048490.1 histamine N-methyltransferase-like [Patiria miniata]